MSRFLNILRKNDFLHSVGSKIRTIFRRYEYRKYVGYPGLIGVIHPEDAMMDGNIEHYLKVGKEAVDIIEESMGKIDLSLGSVKSVLDMPSGYGRVLRHLAGKIDPALITACDIDEKAIDFCVKEFGCKKILSSQDPSSLDFKEKYSLIWVGSLFTHFNVKRFDDLLCKCFESLDSNGLLVFTTHGNYSMEIFGTYWGIEAISKIELIKALKEGGGFYYTPYYNSEESGISISLKEYVEELISLRFGNRSRIVFYKERGWDEHQDVFAIQKLPSI